jgi:hypothetical protein
MTQRRSTLPGRKGRFEPTDPSRPRPRGPPERSIWDDEARRIIRSEMERRDISYKQLVQLLETQPGPPLDFAVTERNLISRISRGTFSFSFALQVLRAMGVRSLDVAAVDPPPVQSRIRT